jgi:hypothetical protein
MPGRSNDDLDNEEARETTDTDPLLDNPARHGRSRTPLPKLQLASLFLIKLVVPVASTQITPYVNDLVQRFRFTDNPARIGLYSGILVSLFEFGRVNACRSDSDSLRAIRGVSRYGHS